MLLKILGSGTIKTPYVKNCSGYLINEEFLMDIGPGVWRALGQNQIKNENIKYIALSHFHADHISDLAPFLLERYLLPEEISKKLILIGPNGLKKWFSQFSELFGEWMQSIHIELMENDHECRVENYKINMLPTGHSSNSICFRIECNNKVLFYSGDSGENENLKKLSRNADVAIFEASNIPQTKIEEHLTPQLASHIALQSNVKNLILTHFYPEVYDSESLKEASNIFKNKIIFAEDNMNIEI
jgi:ribonuclease BN (tRNA processing enzyme)